MTAEDIAEIAALAKRLLDEEAQYSNAYREALVEVGAEWATNGWGTASSTGFIMSVESCAKEKLPFKVNEFGLEAYAGDFARALVAVVEATS